MSNECVIHTICTSNEGTSCNYCEHFVWPIFVDITISNLSNTIQFTYKIAAGSLRLFHLC